MIHFTKDQPMTEIDGDTVISFIAGIDKAMEEAGVGQYRAFKLMVALKAIGLGIKAVERGPVTAAPESAGEQSEA